jgi:RimJ/RimL family protein N-acetyltransferase
MKCAVHIEPVSLKYAESLQRLISDPAVAEPTSNIPHPYPAGGAAAWLEDTVKRWAEGTTYGFAILREEEFVGSCSLLGVSDGQAEVGYWIGHPFWGNGYATEAGLQLTAFAFGEAKLERLIGKCLVRNHGSFRVLEKLGFHLTGFSQVSRPKWPAPEKVAEFILTREAWRENRR